MSLSPLKGSSLRSHSGRISPSQHVSVPEGSILQPELTLAQIALQSAQQARLQKLFHACGMTPHSFDLRGVTDPQGDKQGVSHLFRHIFTHYTKIEWGKVDHNFLLTLQDAEGMNLFFAAIRDNQDGLIDHLLQGAPQECIMRLKDTSHRTAPHIAIFYGRDLILEKLLAYCSDLAWYQQADCYNLTPLQWGIHEGRYFAVEKLLDLGLMHQTWELPHLSVELLALAVTSLHQEILLQLLRHHTFDSAFLKTPIPGFGNLLHLAIHLNQPVMLEALLEASGVHLQEFLNMKDPVGRTPLQLAAFLGDIWAMHQIIVAGDLTHHQEIGGFKTALHFAAQGEKAEAITFLRALGLDASVIDAQGKTPLAYLYDYQSFPPAVYACIQAIHVAVTGSKTPLDFNPAKGRAPLNLILTGNERDKEALITEMQRLEAQDLLKGVQRVSGTGMGSVGAALLALGGTAKMVEDLPFYSLEDLLVIRKERTSETLEGAYHVEHEKNSISAGILRQNLESWISEVTGVHEFTLGDLRECVNKKPHQYKHLHFLIFSLKTREHIHVSSENSWDQELIVADLMTVALASSLGIESISLSRRNAFRKRVLDKLYGECRSASIDKPLGDIFETLLYQEDCYFVGKHLNQRTKFVQIDRSFAKDKNHPLCVESTFSHASFMDLEHFPSSHPHRREDGVFEERRPFLQRSSESYLTKYYTPKKYELFINHHINAKGDLKHQRSISLKTLPLSSSQLISRLKELKELEIAFQTSNKVALVGYVGVGKKTLAMEYAKSLSEDHLTYFISGKSVQEVKEEIAWLERLWGRSSFDMTRKLDFMSVKLKRLGMKALIVISDIQDEATLIEIIALSLAYPHFKLLITKQTAGMEVQSGFKPILMTPFSQEEGLAYFLKRAHISSHEGKIAKMLLEEVGSLPSTLKHIIKYVAEKKISLHSYKAAIQTFKGEASLKSQGKDLPPLMTLHALTHMIEQIEGGAFAAPLLEFMVFLGEKEIPFLLIKAWMEEVYPEETTYALQGVLQIFQTHSLLEEHYSAIQGSVYAHIDLTIKAAIQGELSVERTKQIGIHAWKSLDRVMREMRKNQLTGDFTPNPRLQSAYKDNILKIYHTKEVYNILNLEERAQLLSHLGWLFSSLQPRHLGTPYIEEGLQMEKSLGEESQAFAELLHLKAEYYNTPANYSQVIDWLQKSIAIKLKLFGDTSLELLESKSLLLPILIGLSKHEEALSLGLQVLKNQKILLGESHPETLKTQDLIRNALTRLKRDEEAISFAKEVFLSQRKALGKMHEKTLYSYQTLREILYRLNQREELLKIYQERLLHLKNVIGEEDLVISCYDLIIQLLQQLSRREESLTWAEEKLTYLIACLGETHEKTLKGYDEVIQLLQQCNKVEPALVFAKGKLASLRAVFGEADVKILCHYDHVIQLLQKLKQSEEALMFAEEKRVLLKRNLDFDHEMTLRGYDAPIMILCELKRYEEALALSQERMIERRKSLGSHHEKLLDDYHLTIQCLKFLKKEEEALLLAKEKLSKLKALFGETHDKTLIGWEECIQLLKYFNRKEEAISLAKERLSQVRALLGETDAKTLNSYYYTFSLLRELDLKEEGLSLAKEKLANLKNDFRNVPMEVFRCYDQVVELLKQLNQKEEMISFAKEKLIHLKNHFGESHDETLNYIETFTYLL
ncbi:MAG: hypothetical protein QRY71_00680, partial [Candidatus Rhabdochlamydia sp.]